MPTDKQRAATMQTKTKVAKDLEKAANTNKEEEVDVDDICIGNLYIGGKCELDTNEVWYLIFVVSVHKYSIFIKSYTNKIHLYSHISQSQVI